MTSDVFSEDAFENFCGGVFWNTTLTFGHNATWPEFSDCFQQTILAWVPCGVLWVTLPFNLYYMMTRRGLPIKLSWLTLFKTMLSVILFVLAIIELSEAGSIDRNHSYLPVNLYVTPTIKASTFILSAVLLHVERKYGFITSGVQFVFWGLQALAGVVPFYTSIIYLTSDDYRESTTEVESISVYYIEYAVILAQFILHCRAEKVPYGQYEETEKERCPELEASFLSLISFWWMRSLLVKGFNNTLLESDMWDMNPRDKSANILPEFDVAWAKEMKQCAEKQRKYDLAHSLVTRQSSWAHINSESDETTPLVSGGHVEFKGQKDKRKVFEPSLGKVLIKTYGGTLFISFLCKLVYDLLTFVSPMILNLMIEFTEDKTIATWKGYIYALAIFGAALLQSIFYHQCFRIAMPLGMRVKSVIIASIYRKALVMNNESRNKATVGEIVNLMSVDAQRLQDVTVYLFMAWSCPLIIALTLYMLYTYLKVAIFAGVGFLILTFLINSVVVKHLGSLTKQIMAVKDDRLKLMNEILSGIKVLKLYAWEKSFEGKVFTIRNKELKYLLSYLLLIMVIIFFATLTPLFVTLVTFGTYIFISKDHTLNASKAFVSLTLFNILRMPLTLLPMVVGFVVQGRVSLNRVSKFLNLGELDKDLVTKDPNNENAISIENGTFAWGKDRGACLSDVNLKIKEGQLVAVVGQVGAGKSSLISAMLGEMEKIEGKVNIKSSVAYVAQEAWIQNATMRDNILFGSHYHATTYDDVIDSCALKQDLTTLAGGDLTEIGEKGINLSGGQKQRVSLARAVYNDADIYLLDDPLSAVDSHVGKHIFDNVISNEGLLQNKTRILVTHGIHWLPAVDLIVVVTNGRISEVGTYDELLDHQGPLASLIINYVQRGEKEDEEDLDPEVEVMKARVLQRVESIISTSGEFSHSGESTSDIRQASLDLLQRHLSQLSQKSTEQEGAKVKVKSEKREEPPRPEKLIDEEKMGVGKIKWSTYSAYIKALGYVLWSIFFGMMVIYTVLSVYSKLWITFWTDDPIFRHPEFINTSAYRDANNKYLAGYGGFGAGQALCVVAYLLAASFAFIHASRILHKNLLSNIMKSPMSFFDTTPQGRIVNRFSRDIETIDGTLPQSMQQFVGSGLGLISTAVIISYSTPIFLAVIAPTIVIYYLIQRFYIPTLRQLKRLESTTRSPIFTNFTETINGVASIRAFGVQSRFVAESDARVDNNLSFYYAEIFADRWLGVRLELLSNCLVFAASVFAILGRDTLEGGIVGLSLTYALQITMSLTFLVRVTSTLEANAVSIERIREYTEAPSEAAWDIPDTKPAEGWPDTGHIQFCDYKTRYRPGLDLVLNGISADIKAGEKVGIVGRTGAGKSSLTLALFRLIEAADGFIMVDGVDIGKMGLHDLRSRLTILPQDPMLFAGTMRMNLDPLERHSDEEIWYALEQANLKTYVAGLADGLEYNCGEGGHNLSVGQRQLVCLARTLLHKTKILVLDEATAAVDIETDELIQKTIRSEFSECTVLTIAHRLNTIMDSDRIIVLDGGLISEFDTPSNLLRKRKGNFYSLAKQAGLL